MHPRERPWWRRRAVCGRSCTPGRSRRQGWQTPSKDCAAMAGFSAAWLGLREPADRAARAAAVTTFVVEALGRRSGLRVLDLGAGTGANLRYLAERLSGNQFWTL